MLKNEQRRGPSRYMQSPERETQVEADPFPYEDPPPYNTRRLTREQVEMAGRVLVLAHEAELRERRERTRGRDGGSSCRPRKPFRHSKPFCMERPVVRTLSNLVAASSTSACQLSGYQSGTSFETAAYSSPWWLSPPNTKVSSGPEFRIVQYQRCQSRLGFETTRECHKSLYLTPCCHRTDVS